MRDDHLATGRLFRLPLRIGRPRSLGLLAAAAALLVATVSGCGGSSGGTASGASTYNKLNSAPAGKAESMALEMAKKEGSVSLYTSYQSSAADAMKKAFEQKYPDITVNLYRGHSSDVLQKISQEAQAGRIGADVAECSFGEINDLAEQGLFTPYRGPNRAKVAKAGQFPDWTSDYFEFMLPVWNTDIVKNPPRKWSDLANPRFKGKMVVEPGDSDWYAALSDYWTQQGKSPQEIKQLWQGIAQNAHAVKGHSTMAQLAGAGQAGIVAMDYTYVSETFIKKGAPLAYKINGKAPVPAFPRPNGLGMLKDAKHPAAAWLLANWILDPEGGQKVLASHSAIPSTADIHGSAYNWVKLADWPAQDLIKNQKKYSDEFDQLMRGVPKQGG